MGRIVLFCVIALIGMSLLTLLALFFRAGLGFVRLDLVGFSGFQAVLDAQGAAAGPGIGDAMSSIPIQLLVALQLATISFNAFFSSVFAFDEELGWRGWLLPNLRPLRTWPALLMSGAIWGVWHAPLILLDWTGWTGWTG